MDLTPNSVRSMPAGLVDYISSDEEMMDFAVDVASSVIDQLGGRVGFYRTNPAQGPFGSGPLKHSLKRVSQSSSSVSNKRTATLSAHARDGRTNGHLKPDLLWLFFPKNK